jgi:hypothetical protein
MPVRKEHCNAFTFRRIRFYVHASDKQLSKALLIIAVNMKSSVGKRFYQLAIMKTHCNRPKKFSDTFIIYIALTHSSCSVLAVRMCVLSRPILNCAALDLIT